MEIVEEEEVEVKIEENLLIACTKPEITDDINTSQLTIDLTMEENDNIIKCEPLDLVLDRSETTIETEDWDESDYFITDIADQIIIGNELDINECKVSERYITYLVDQIIRGNEIEISECNILERYKESKTSVDMTVVPSVQEVNVKKEIVDPFDMELNRIKPEQVKTENYENCNLVVEHIMAEEDGEVVVKIEEMESGVYADKKPFDDMESIWLTEELDIKADSDTEISDAASERAANKKNRKILHRKTAPNTFSCYNCEYTTYHKAGLIEHIKVHTKHVSWPCENYDDTFKNILSPENYMIDHDYSR